MIFVNTRPHHQATALSAYLKQPKVRQMLGEPLCVVDMPLLKIMPISLSESSLHKLGCLSDYRVLVVVSVNAWQYAKDLVDVATLTTLSRQSLTVIAVGAATAHALMACGVHCQMPKTANNEGMLAMSAINNLTATDKVMIWRGVGGRTLLNDVLQARGMTVDGIAFYERTKPDALNLQPLCADDAAQTDIVVLITSQQAFEHWCQSAQDLAGAVTYIALGARLTSLVQHKSKEGVRVLMINDLAPDSILQAILTIQHQR